MQCEDATPALSPASAGREHGTDLVQGQLAGASADHGSGDETGAPSTMHDVRVQGTGMERPFRLDRFASDARANLQRGRMTNATVDSVVYFVRRGTVETTRLYRVVRTANVFAPERFDRSTEAWVWDAAFFVGLRHSGDSRIVEIDPTEAATLETRLRERTARERARSGTGVWADY